jgi:hypothetical protein
MDENPSHAVLFQIGLLFIDLLSGHPVIPDPKWGTTVFRWRIAKSAENVV